MADNLQILKVNPWHDQLAKYMILNPTSTLAETAEHFKVSASWICIVKNSDAFKTHYNQVSNGVFASAVEEIYGQTAALTSLALTKLTKKVKDIGDNMSPAELLNVADIGLKRLGYGASKSSPAPAVINNNNSFALVNQGDLELARRKMSEAHGVTVSDQRASAVPQIPLAVSDAEVVT